MRVLLVEDERNLGLILRTELVQDEYTVCQVQNGVDAVLEFLDDRPDIVLMDLRLPRLQGVDAIRIMKAVSPDVPVIAFSGRAGRQEQEDAVAAGAALCLSKPFEVKRLISEMGKLLGVEGGRVHA